MNSVSQGETPIRVARNAAVYAPKSALGHSIGAVARLQQDAVGEAREPCHRRPRVHGFRHQVDGLVDLATGHLAPTDPQGVMPRGARVTASEGNQFVVSARGDRSLRNHRNERVDGGTRCAAQGT